MLNMAIREGSLALFSYKSWRISPRFRILLNIWKSPVFHNTRIANLLSINFIL